MHQRFGREKQRSRIPTNRILEIVQRDRRLLALITFPPSINGVDHVLLSSASRFKKRLFLDDSINGGSMCCSREIDFI